jgi:hypothetical protein
MTEVSKRTFVRKRLNSVCNSSVGKKQFYAGVCDLNDNILRLKNFSEAIEFLHSADNSAYKNLYKRINHE